MKNILLFVVVFVSLISFPAFAVDFAGNGNGGFGGVIGNGQLTLTDDGSTLSGVITRGPDNFNDAFVIYIDSEASGFTSTATFTDTADLNRASVSAFNGTNRATINLPIAADYAISFIPTVFSGVWKLNSANNFTFQQAVSLSPGTNNATSYTFSLSVASIGLTPNSGQSFSFVATYLNATNAFLSNETLSGITGFGATNPGTNTPTTLAGSLNYTIIPEPSSIALAILGIAGSLALFRHRKK